MDAHEKGPVRRREARYVWRNPLSNAEPLGCVVGAAIAILVAVLASLAPARRAASVQPMVAMRSV